MIWVSHILEVHDHSELELHCKVNFSPFPSPGNYKLERESELWTDENPNDAKDFGANMPEYFCKSGWLQMRSRSSPLRLP